MRAEKCWAAAPRSTPWCICAGRPATTTSGNRSATPAGAGTTCCPCSSAPKTTISARTRCTARAENGASSASVSPGKSSMPSEAMAEAGIPKIPDFNRGDNEGSGLFEVNQKRGVRWNASKAFLRPAMRHPNLTVITHAQVRRLRMDGRKAAGVEFFRGNEESFAEARIETILAAGAIGSPLILQLSGIGPGALLSQHGIAVTHESPGVGENLQDHLQLRMGFKVRNVRTLNEWANTLSGRISMGLEYLFFRTGPLAMAPSQLGGFTRSDPAQKSANLEYHIQPLSLDRFGEPLHPFPAFTASVANLRPASRGSVKIKSSDPRAAPAIRPNYLSTDADRKIAAEALRLTRRIAQQPALARYQPNEFLPGAGLRSDEELAGAAGDIGTTIFHPVGTCRMGPDSDPRAVG